MNIPFDPLVIMTPVFVAALVLEMALRRRSQSAYGAKDTATSVAMAIGNAISGFLFVAIPIKLGELIAPYRLLDLEFSLILAIICFIADDFFAYWAHRVGHSVRWVWADHVIHHSSKYYNFSTALRQGWFVYFTPGLLMMIPMMVIGFPAEMLVFTHGLNLSYQFFVHTESVGKLPRWFEFIMNTPSHHRVHHGANARYVDRNFGCVFIIWDRVFGTFVEEDAADPPRYGLTQDIGTFNVLRVSLHEWVAMLRDVLAAESPREAFHHLLGPPGRPSAPLANLPTARDARVSSARR